MRRANSGTACGLTRSAADEGARGKPPPKVELLCPESTAEGAFIGVSEFPERKQLDSFVQGRAVDPQQKSLLQNALFWELETVDEYNGKSIFTYVHCETKVWQPASCSRD